MQARGLWMQENPPGSGPALTGPLGRCSAPHPLSASDRFYLFVPSSVQLSTVSPGGRSPCEGWSLPVTRNRFPSMPLLFLSSSPFVPPANTNWLTGPGISSRRNSSLTARVPTAATSISPGVNPASFTAFGILAGSKLFPVAGNTTAWALFRSTLTFPTPSRRRRAFSAP